MILEIPAGAPAIDKTAGVAENAAVIGDVVIGPGSSVWFGAVLRGDKSGVRLGENTNVQDNAVLHNARLGNRVTVGHAAVLDGCAVEDDCLIGMNATVLHDAVIGRGSLIAAGALIPEGMEVPPGSLVMGVPGRVRGCVTPEQADMMAQDWQQYVRLAEAEL